jgi:hypothetical protein
MPAIDNMWHYVLYAVIIVIAITILKSPKKK